MIQKEFINEWKQKFSLGGIVLYVFSTAFIVALVYKNTSLPVVWNASFWIILLFAAINTVAKSFMQENSAQQLYLYTLAHPVNIILSKIVYNFLLLLVIGLLTYSLFAVLSGNPVKSVDLFLFAIAVGAYGFAGILTLISSIASKSKNSGSLMAILSFPLMIPFVLSSIRLSEKAIKGLEFTDSYNELQILIGIAVVMSVVSTILFPYLWRE